jgi:hypothetical protein
MTERDDSCAAGRGRGEAFRARVASALAELEKVARELLESQQHVAPEAKVEAVELPVVLGFHGAATRVAGEFRLAEAEKIVELLRGRVRDALLNAVAFERGHVYCLRCESSRCNHSSPPGPRSIFSGYEETGRPDWVELDKLLHRRADPRLERLYGRDGAPMRGRRDAPLVAVALHRDEIYGRLLPGFDEARWRCFVLGQLCVGWFVPAGVEGARDDGGPREPREVMALTVQIVRSEKAPDGALVGINVVGRLPAGVAPAAAHGGAPLDESVLDGLPRALRRLRSEIGVFSGRGGTRAPGIGIALDRLANRCHQLLREASRELEHRRRTDERRTGHARERARQGDRPTHKAFEDARAAADDHFFFDVQEKTVCVVGPSNRVHFFTPEGKQVTSVVFPGHVVQQRVGSKRWAPLEPEKRAALRRAFELAGAPPE